MRSSSSYRAGRKKIAKEAGVPLAKINTAFDVAARAAEASPPGMGEEAARRELARWAASGGRQTAVSMPATAAALQRMNSAAVAHVLKTTPAAALIDAPAPATVETATAAVKKLTPADIDKAMESALTRWQAERHNGPLPLGKLFAARARELGWVEDVEFVEE